jgi:hypothetical protein
MVGPKASEDHLPLSLDKLRFPALPIGIPVTELSRLVTYVYFNVRFASCHNGTVLLPVPDAEDSEHTLKAAANILN